MDRPLPPRLAQLEQEFGLVLDFEQKHRIRRYLQLLQKWGRSLNLSGEERVERLLRFHFFESFWAVSTFSLKGKRLVDVGSGAGFPGLAMKLYAPSLELTLVEKNSKKAVFLKTVARELELAVPVFPGPAEEYPGWAEAEMALVRALKPSRRLWALWRQGGIQVLLFHGASPSGLPSDFQIQEQARVPLSLQRWVSRLRPGAARFT